MTPDFAYKRIIILGGSGSGKSTLAARISSYTGYPAYHLDTLLLNNDWTQKDKSQWHAICAREFLSKDVGIVDGTYSFVLPERIAWADLIIFIDVPMPRQLCNAFKRSVFDAFGLEKRHGVAQGRKNSFTFKLFMWILRWNKSRRQKVLTFLESAGDKKIIITSKPKKLDIQLLFAKNML